MIIIIIINNLQTRIEICFHISFFLIIVLNNNERVLFKQLINVKYIYFGNMFSIVILVANMLNVMNYI